MVGQSGSWTAAAAFASWRTGAQLVPSRRERNRPPRCEGASHMNGVQVASLLAIAALLVGPAKCQATGGRVGETRAPSRVRVAGRGVDLLSTAIVHSKQTTATGYVQKGTESVDLEGDLRGRVLYHVTTVVDEVHGTLVNTGEEVFSGTVVGS